MKSVLKIFSRIVAFMILAFLGRESNAADLMNIVVVDQTTKYDSPSMLMLQDGVKAYLDSCDFNGDILVVGIDGASIRYVKIFEYAEFENINTSRPTYNCQRKGAYEYGYSECEIEYLRKYEIWEKYIKNKKDVARNIYKSINKYIEELKQSRPETNISDQLYSLFERNCIGKNCNLFIFSDMIEVNIRDLKKKYEGVGPFNSIEEDKKVAGSQGLYRYDFVSMNNYRNFDLKKVVIWGFGRDENYEETCATRPTEKCKLQPQVTAEEPRLKILNESQKTVIQAYWTNFFSRSSNSPQIEFHREMPNSGCASR